MNPARLLRVERSAAELPEAGTLRRTVRRPEKSRPAAFAERFEDRALVYDCFWQHDGSQVLLVGPPPMNLMPALADARYRALPSGTALRARYHPSLSTMTTALAGVPAGSTAIRMEVGEAAWELAIQPNHAADLAGRRLLIGMNKDNELRWISEWARWHAALHGTDAIVLFDNGSRRYAAAEIEAALRAVPGIATVVVPVWPGRFGMTDPALHINPYWSHFLQIAAMGVALRRFGAAAAGILNCDIDELAATRSGRAIYQLLPEARRGLVVFRGQWIEALGDAAVGHRGFTQRLRDPRAARSGPGKWVLDPRQAWVRNLDVHPYWHWIEHRPWLGKSMPADAFYWHFKGINTSWKEARAVPVAAALVEPDAALAAAFARVPS